MAFSGNGKVWMNGKIVDWADANIHIATHIIHYGSGVFEGARCYSTPKGSVFFRLCAHMRRLYDSARIYRMDYALDCETLTRGVIDTVITNGMDACYIRPLIYRGCHAGPGRSHRSVGPSIRSGRAIRSGGSVRSTRCKWARWNRPLEHFASDPEDVLHQVLRPLVTIRNRTSQRAHHDIVHGNRHLWITVPRRLDQFAATKPVQVSRGGRVVR